MGSIPMFAKLLNMHFQSLILKCYPSVLKQKLREVYSANLAVHGGSIDMHKKASSKTSSFTVANTVTTL
jgi:hypothetical protein